MTNDKLKLLDIEQATIPIREFVGIEGNSGNVIAGRDIPHAQSVEVYEFDYYDECSELVDIRRGNGIEDLHTALKDFVDDNKGNPNVYNPFNDDGSYDEKNYLYEAYDTALALSHWDDIVSKYSDIIHPNAEPVMKGESYNSRALMLGSAAYLGEKQGMDERDIKLMLDNSTYESGYMNLNTMHDVRHMFKCGLDYDTVAFTLENTTDISRVGVMNYIHNNGDKPIDKDNIEIIGSCKDRDVARELSESVIKDEFNKDELKDIVSATNLYLDYVIEKQGYNYDMRLMPSVIEDIKDIHAIEIEGYDIMRAEHPEVKQTRNQVDGIVFGDNKITDIMKSYIEKSRENVADKVDYSSNIKVFYFDNKEVESVKEPVKNIESDKPKFEHIKIPSGLVDGPHEGKYGQFDVIKVPFEDKFGKMTVSHGLVDNYGKTSNITLPSDRNRTVQFYDKDTKTTSSQDFSVSELKEVYEKNWERLKSRNKSLDTKFEDVKENSVTSPDFE